MDNVRYFIIGVGMLTLVAIIGYPFHLLIEKICSYLPYKPHGGFLYKFYDYIVETIYMVSAMFFYLNPITWIFGFYIQKINKNDTSDKND